MLLDCNQWLETSDLKQHFFTCYTGGITSKLVARTVRKHKPNFQTYWFSWATMLGTYPLKWLKRWHCKKRSYKLMNFSRMMSFPVAIAENNSENMITGNSSAQAILGKFTWRVKSPMTSPYPVCLLLLEISSRMTCASKALKLCWTLSRKPALCLSTRPRI